MIVPLWIAWCVIAALWAGLMLIRSKPVKYAGMRVLLTYALFVWIGLQLGHHVAVWIGGPPDGWLDLIGITAGIGLSIWLAHVISERLITEPRRFNNQNVGSQERSE